MDPYTASQLVINSLPEGVLEKNGWNPFAGGDFDPSKLFTANTQTSSNVIPYSSLETQANSLGINLQTVINDAEMQGYQIDRTR